MHFGARQAIGGLQKMQDWVLEGIGIWARSWGWDVAGNIVGSFFGSGYGQP